MGLIALFSLKPMVALAAGQSGQPVAAQMSQNDGQAAGAWEDSLRPALLDVGSALNQVRMDRWKVSRDWKRRLQSDAGSIHQDLSTQLPALFQAAQQSSTALGPQLAVMHNVDALYDVLVRVTTAASLAGGKRDAAVMENALAGLESARKSAATQLMAAAAQRDRQFLQFQARTAGDPPEATPRDSRHRVVVVNNRISHKTKRTKSRVHPKPAPGTPSNSH